MVRLRVPGGRVAAADLVEVSSRRQIRRPRCHAHLARQPPAARSAEPAPRELVTAIGALRLVRRRRTTRHATSSPTRRPPSATSSGRSARRCSPTTRSPPCPDASCSPSPRSAGRARRAVGRRGRRRGASARVLVDGRALVVPARTPRRPSSTSRAASSPSAGRAGVERPRPARRGPGGPAAGGSPFVVDVGSPPRRPARRGPRRPRAAGSAHPAMAAALAGPAGMRVEPGPAAPLAGRGASGALRCEPQRASNGSSATSVETTLVVTPWRSVLVREALRAPPSSPPPVSSSPPARRGRCSRPAPGPRLRPHDDADPRAGPRGALVDPSARPSTSSAATGRAGTLLARTRPRSTRTAPTTSSARSAAP